MGDDAFESRFFDKIVGLPTKYKDKLPNWIEHSNEIIRSIGGKKIEGLELEKSPRDLEILNFVENAATKIQRKYGRTKDIKIPLNNIHILEVGGVEKYTQGNLKIGGHAPRSRSIAVDRDPSDIQFALVSFHETTHLKSYSALQIMPRDSKSGREGGLIPYRSGVSIRARDGKMAYFKDVEEAVTCLLEQEFFNDHIKHSNLFQDELLQRERENSPVAFSRPQEVAGTNKFIAELAEKNPEGLGHDQLQRLLIESHVSGDIRRMGRLIDRTFGIGTSRVLGAKSGMKEPDTLE